MVTDCPAVSGGAVTGSGCADVVCVGGSARAPAGAANRTARPSTSAARRRMSVMIAPRPRAGKDARCARTFITRRHPGTAPSTRGQSRRREEDGERGLLPPVEREAKDEIQGEARCLQQMLRAIFAVARSGKPWRTGRRRPRIRAVPGVLRRAPIPLEVGESNESRLGVSVARAATSLRRDRRASRARGRALAAM